MPVTLTRAAEVQAIASADRLLAELNALYAEATAVRREARENGSGAGWAFGLAESHRLLKTLADLIERMQAGGAATREQLDERAAVLRALRPYPAALLAAIAEMENGNG